MGPIRFDPYTGQLVITEPLVPKETMTTFYTPAVIIEAIQIQPAPANTSPTLMFGPLDAPCPPWLLKARDRGDIAFGFDGTSWTLHYQGEQPLIPRDQRDDIADNNPYVKAGDWMYYDPADNRIRFISDAHLHSWAVALDVEALAQRVLAIDVPGSQDPSAAYHLVHDLMNAVTRLTQAPTRVKDHS